METYIATLWNAAKPILRGKFILTNAHIKKKRMILNIQPNITPGVTDNFGLGVQNEAGQRTTQFCQDNTLVKTNTLFPKYQEITVHVDNTRWSIPKSN